MDETEKDSQGSVPCISGIDGARYPGRKLDHSFCLKKIEEKECDPLVVF